jgi:hypothetical protein
MTKIQTIFIALAILALAFVSCKNDSYAEKRKAEQRKWQAYKEAKNLEISTDSLRLFGGKGVSRITGYDTIFYPIPCPWPENLYFQTYRGAYIRLIENDTTKRQAKEGQEVVLRFCSYDLDDNLQIDNHDHNIYRDGFNFVYTPGTEDPSVGIAFTDAVACIHHGSKFELIIDSKLGIAEQMEAVVTLRIDVDETTIRNQ